MQKTLLSSTDYINNINTVGTKDATILNIEVFSTISTVQYEYVNRFSFGFSLK